MRTWLSAPIGGGYRVGASVNPNALLTRELPWQQLLSPAGRTALYIGGAAMGVGMVAWMVHTEGHWDEQWLAMLIVALLGRWILKRTVLALFPRQFDEEQITEPSSPDQTLPC